VASLEQTRRIFTQAQSEDKQLLVREGEFHELHRELKRDMYMQAFADQFEKWAKKTQSREAAQL